MASPSFFCLWFCFISQKTQSALSAIIGFYDIVNLDQNRLIWDFVLLFLRVIKLILTFNFSFQASLEKLMRPSLRLVLLAFSLVLVLGAMAQLPVVAQTDDSALSAQTHDQAIKTAPGKFIQTLGDKAIGVIANKNISVDQRSDRFRALLQESFDLMTIGRFVIGRSWNAASPAQQQDYMKLFEALVIKTYGNRLTLYTGEGFSVTGVRQESEKDSIVNSQITHPDGSTPTTIDWRVRNRNGKLGVIDVVVEGVSLSVTQRQEYAAVIQSNGGQIDGLLDTMRQQLKGGNSN